MEEAPRYSLYDLSMSFILMSKLAICTEDRRKTVGVCRTIMSSRQKKHPLSSIEALFFFIKIANLINARTTNHWIQRPQPLLFASVVGRTQKNRISLSTVRFSVYD